MKTGLEDGLEFRNKMEKQAQLVDTHMKGYPLERTSVLKCQLSVWRLSDEDLINECTKLKAKIDREASSDELDAVMEHL